MTVRYQPLMYYTANIGAGGGEHHFMYYIANIRGAK